MEKKRRQIFKGACTAFFLALTSISLTADAVQTTIYASPSGSGNTGSLEKPSSLTDARDLARTINAHMTGDIVIYLRGGTYNLTSSFTLNESATIHDSGTNGFNIIYKAYPKETPIISGGMPITGWTLYDRDKDIYRAKVDPALQTRQLYVDGERAIRARSAEYPAGWTKTATGWTITDETMQNWKNQSDIEIVARSQWKHLRCDIASITGTTVVMKTPGWTNSCKSPNLGKPWNGAGLQQINAVLWIENAYELLQSPGQWYLDRKAGYIYYIPYGGENMSTVSVVAPVVEKLVDAQGSGLDSKIHNIEFVGITFEYGTWLAPSGDQGYADNQAGIVWIDTPPKAGKTAGNLSFQFASNIQLQNNTVAHMGGAAIDFGHGAQNNVILGNCIYDISGGGIDLGNVTDYATTDPNAMTDANVIKDNYITRIGAEYEDQVGIWVGYSRNLAIDHNEIADVPYSGISVGWGWGAFGYSFKNSITNNYVDNSMQVLHDGGGIYTLGNQGDAQDRTIWRGNYLQKMNHGNGLYPDEGSGWMDLNNNVVLDVPSKSWVMLWTRSIHDVAVHDNFSDSTKTTNHGTQCPMENNALGLQADDLPSTAQAIIKDAGLQPDYASLRSKVPPLAWTIANDSDSAITYKGAWKAKITNNAIAYDIHYTKNNGDSASLAFNGRGIEYVTEFYSDEGEVEIYLDDVLAKTVDCHSPSRLMQQIPFQVRMPLGPHVIKIVKKSGKYMILDAFKILQSATSSPQTH